MLLAYIKRGAYNSFFYASSSALVRCINIFILPYFLSMLSIAEFGALDFYQTWFSWFSLLLSSSSATAMIRFYLLYKNDEEKQKQSIANALWATLGSIGLMFCIAIGASYAYSLYLTKYFMLTMLNASLFALCSMLFAYYRMKESLWLYCMVFCGSSIFTTLLTVLGIAYGYGIEAFFYANIISCCTLVPLFFIMLKQYCYGNWAIAKQQAAYSLPLLGYAFLYSFFFNTDRLLLSSYHGFEALGWYGLLWRFGSIFQFIAIALTDAWPIILYNAQKEEQSQLLIRQLTAIFCIVIAFCCLMTAIGSFYLINWFFPVQYHYLTMYLPLFFVPLIIIEYARIVQAGFGLSAKTIYVPFITGIIVIIQYTMLYYLVPYGLWSVFFANSIAFSLYGILNYYVGTMVYSQSIVDTKSIFKIIGSCLLCLAILHIAYYFNYANMGTCIVLMAMCFLSLTGKIISLEDRQSIQASIFQWWQSWNRNNVNYNNSQSKTILYLRTDICSDELKAGGSVAHTLGVIKGFQQKGIHIVCASSAMVSLLQKMSFASFKPLKVWPLFILLRWKLGYARWRLECIFSNLFFIVQIHSFFKNNRIDYIYQRYSLLNGVGYLLKLWKKVPLILEYNGSEVWQFDQLAPKKWFKFNALAHCIEKINIHGADYVVVVSQALKDDLVNKGVVESKILVNPNGVDVEQFNPATLITTRSDIRTQLNIDTTFVFGFVGTFSFWHGIEIFAHLIPALIKQNPHVHFILIGDGPLRHSLYTQLQQHGIGQEFVTFTGLVSPEQAKHYLAACDAFLSPTQPNKDGTRFFGSPTKIFEYLSMAKPVIASDLEQIAELLSPAFTIDDISSSSSCVVTNQIGILVQPNDVYGFINAALWISSLPKKEQERLGENARNKASLYYTWSKHVDNIQRFIKEKE